MYITECLKGTDIIQRLQKDNIPEESINKILFFMGTSIKCRVCQKNESIIRIGDKPDNFYIIFSGSVSVLKLNSGTKEKMDLETYINYLLSLKRINEHYILKLTMKANREIFNISESNLDDLGSELVNNKIRNSIMINPDPFSLENILSSLGVTLKERDLEILEQLKIIEMGNTVIYSNNPTKVGRKSKSSGKYSKKASSKPRNSMFEGSKVKSKFDNLSAAFMRQQNHAPKSTGSMFELHGPGLKKTDTRSSIESQSKETLNEGAGQKNHRHGHNKKKKRISSMNLPDEEEKKITSTPSPNMRNIPTLKSNSKKKNQEIKKDQRIENNIDIVEELSDEASKDNSNNSFKAIDDDDNDNDEEEEESDYDLDQELMNQGEDLTVKEKVSLIIQKRFKRYFSDNGGSRSPEKKSTCQFRERPDAPRQTSIGKRHMSIRQTQTQSTLNSIPEPKESTQKEDLIESLKIKDVKKAEQVTVYKYIEFIRLKKGQFFGDTAIDEQKERNATIVTQEISLIGAIECGIYRDFIRADKLKIKLKEINFLLENFFMSSIPRQKFDKRYFDLFEVTEYFKGSLIFEPRPKQVQTNTFFVQNTPVVETEEKVKVSGQLPSPTLDTGLDSQEERYLYFVKDGEMELKFNLSPFEINKLQQDLETCIMNFKGYTNEVLNHLMAKKKFENCIPPDPYSKQNQDLISQFAKKVEQSEKIYNYDSQLSTGTASESYNEALAREKSKINHYFSLIQYDYDGCFKAKRKPIIESLKEKSTCLISKVVDSSSEIIGAIEYFFNLNYFFNVEITSPKAKVYRIKSSLLERIFLVEDQAFFDFKRLCLMKLLSIYDKLIQIKELKINQVLIQNSHEFWKKDCEKSNFSKYLNNSAMPAVGKSLDMNSSLRHHHQNSAHDLEYRSFNTIKYTYQTNPTSAVSETNAPQTPITKRDQVEAKKTLKIVDNLNTWRTKKHRLSPPKKIKNKTESNAKELIQYGEECKAESSNANIQGYYMTELKKDLLKSKKPKIKMSDCNLSVQNLNNIIRNIKDENRKLCKFNSSAVSKQIAATIINTETKIAESLPKSISSSKCSKQIVYSNVNFEKGTPHNENTKLLTPNAAPSKSLDIDSHFSISGAYMPYAYRSFINGRYKDSKLGFLNSVYTNSRKIQLSLPKEPIKCKIIHKQEIAHRNMSIS